MTIPIPTVADMLGDIDPATPAGEMLRRATAPERHEARVAATIAAARLWAEEQAAGEPEQGDPAAIATIAAAILYADLIGVGGPLGLGGSGGATTRHPAFGELGKGRRHASDGDAYMAAAEAAFAEAVRELGERLTLTATVDGVDGGRLIAEIGGEGAVDLAEYLEPDWLQVLAGRGLILTTRGRHALDEIVGAGGAGGVLDYLVESCGTAAAWAAVYDDAAQAEPEVDTDGDTES